MHQELEVPLSYYETLTKKEIKKILQDRYIFPSPNSNLYIYQLMINDMENGVSIKRPKYIPTKDDKIVGIVTYMPWKIQDSICKSFSTLLREYAEFVNNPYRKTIIIAINGILEWAIYDIQSSIYFGDFDNCYITQAADSFEISYNTQHQTRLQNGFNDQFMSKMSEIAQEIIKKSKEKTKQNRIKYNNQSLDEENIALTIADYMENFIENRYKDLIKKRKIRDTYLKTFLYGCATNRSGSDILPNIGARHMYYSVRKNIGEYIGAV